MEFEDFKKRFKIQWNAYKDSGWRILPVLYYFDKENKGLTKKELLELTETKEKAFPKALENLAIFTKAVIPISTSEGEKYTLKKGYRELFEELYF